MQRDKYGIIIQEGDPLDVSGGDSAFATGIMAFSDSLDDLFLMPKFIIDGKLVRHPYQDRWNSSDLTSRDQVIAFFAGRSQNAEVQKACLSYAKSWRVNADVLLFADKYYLYRCAGATPSLALKYAAYFNQLINLLWDCFVRPDEEMNQRILMNCVFGPWWIRKMNSWHPNLLKNVMEYFSGWRKKKEIGLMFCDKIIKEIYPSRK